MKFTIIDYIKSLKPHIEKDEIVEDLRITEQELKNNVIPAYQTANAFFTDSKFQSKENNNINSDIRGIFKNLNGVPRSANFIGDVLQRLRMIEMNIPTLDKMINNEIGRDVISDGISSRKAVLIRIVEKFSYISRYSLDLLNLVYLNEAVAQGIDAKEIGMSPVQLTKAKGCVENLAKLLQSYTMEPKEFKKNFDKIPDLIIGHGNNDDVEGTYTDRELDPMTDPTAVGFTGNPIYHARLLVAEWQTKRYKASQEKKKQLEWRLLQLELLKTKSGSNPKIEQEIQYSQQRIAKLDRYLFEVEHDIGVAA